MFKEIALLKISLLILLIISFSFPKDSNYEKVKVAEVGPGFIYYEFVDTTGPIHIYLLEMDLTIPTNKIKVRIANNHLNKGGERTSDLVGRMIEKGEFVIGAVNTDFFGGNPRQAENSMIIDGEYAKGVKLNRGMFAITESNIPYIEDFQFDGYILIDHDTLQINSINSLKTNGVNLFNYNFSETDFIDSTDNYLKIKSHNNVKINSFNEFIIEKIVSDRSKLNIQNGDYWISLDDSIFNNYNLTQGRTLNIYLGTKTTVDDIYTLVGGLPTLVTNGKRPGSYIGTERLTSKGFIGKNPRTVIGYNKEKTKLYVAAIDGRQKSHSIGMSLYELADFMISIGCYDLLNLDGGGSTTITLRDSVVNSPSDKTGERKVYNSLLLVSEEPMENLIPFIEVKPDTITITESMIDINITSKDNWGFPVHLKNNEMLYHSEGGVAYLKNDSLNVNFSQPGFIEIIYGSLSDTIWVKE